MSDPVLQRNRRIQRYFFNRDKEHIKVNWKKVWKVTWKIVKWTLILTGLIIYEIIAIAIAITLLFSVGMGFILIPMLPFLLYIKWEERKFPRYHIVGKSSKNQYPETPDDPIDYNEFWNKWDYFDNVKKQKEIENWKGTVPCELDIPKQDQ